MQRKNEMGDYVGMVLRRLCDDIGSRPAGAGSVNRAEDFVAGEMEAAGYSVEVQDYECPAWEGKGASLKIGDDVFTALPNVHSLPCDVQAPLVCAETREELDGLSLRGKLVLLFGDLSKDIYSVKNFTIYRVDWQDEVIALLEREQPAAVILASPKVGRPVALWEDSEVDIPSVTLEADAGAAVLTAARENKVACLRIDSIRRPGRSSNIIGRRVTGNAPRIAILSHYDTKPGTPGALDNASGVAAQLVAGRMLADKYPDLPVELVAFGGEDSWFPGDMGYPDRNRKYFSQIYLAVNFDAVGLKDAASTVCYLSCSDDLIGKLEAIRQQEKDFVRIDPWYQGDHGIFWPAGIPSVAFVSHGGLDLTDIVIHTALDVPALIDPDKVCQVAAAAVRMCTVNC